GGEVLLLFLQTLAERVAGEASHLDVLADQRDGGAELVLHRPLPIWIAEEGLIQQAHPLKVLLQLAGEDFVEHRLRLALIAQLGPLGIPLLVDLVCGNVPPADPLRLAPGDLHREVLHQRLELLVPGSEVRLAIDLHQHADLAAQVAVRAYRAFGGAAAGLLPRGGQALLAQPGDRLLDVAARLQQGLLAIHHSRAGLLAQLLHHRRSHFRHRVLLLRLRFAAVARLASAQRGLVFHDRTRRRLGLGAHHRAPLPAAASAHAATAAISPATALGSGVAILARFRLGLRRFAGVVRLVARLSLDGRVRDLSAEEPDRADGVVVAGNDVIDPFRIAVGV